MPRQQQPQHSPRTPRSRPNPSSSSSPRNPIPTTPTTSTPSPSTTAASLRAERIRAGLTQTQIARTLHFSRSYISALELGKVRCTAKASVAYLDAIAALLHEQRTYEDRARTIRRVLDRYHDGEVDYANLDA